MFANLKLWVADRDTALSGIQLEFDDSPVKWLKPMESKHCQKSILLCGRPLHCIVFCGTLHFTLFRVLCYNAVHCIIGCGSLHCALWYTALCIVVGYIALCFVIHCIVHCGRLHSIVLCGTLHINMWIMVLITTKAFCEMHMLISLSPLSFFAF